MTTSDQSEKLLRSNKEIAAENDRLRRSLRRQPGFQFYFTSGLMGSDPLQVLAVVSAVQRFNSFDPENDPYGEHDFGSVKVNGEQYFFKFDYYADGSLTFGADPYEAASFVRVLTIMRSDEY